MKINNHHKGLIGSQQLGSTADGQTLDAISQFWARFRRIKEAVGVKTDIALAKVLGIKHSSVASAKDRKSIPLKWIVEISDNYDISCDWLLYGEDAKYRDQVRQISAQPSPPVEALDLDLIREIIVIAEETLENQKLNLPPKKKAELIALLYEEFAEGGERKEISKGKILRFARALAV